jgi:pimeloyl-ACP methyl ester carboxylesterase
MDGTGELFSPLLAHIPADYRPLVVYYPPDQIRSYEQLMESVSEQLSREREMVLLAESFSGPIGIRYAAENPDRVRALVLCVTFARFPVPPIVAQIARHFMCARPPDWALRLLLAGNANEDMLREVRRVMRRVDPTVLADRFAQTSRIDVRQSLSRCTMPVLYLGASEDRLISSKRRREMMQICPHMRVAKIRAPHLLLQTAPAHAWRCIAEFIASS